MNKNMSRARKKKIMKKRSAHLSPVMLHVAATKAKRPKFRFSEGAASEVRHIVKNGKVLEK